ncbi:LAMI_0G11892g1_1 [Lachancea mirantina]|uniref:LAMI_0G11892g1_1 n=1 Tax=Lachancea mirantina TaxID=1230905 RepID=A0A1G4KB47_9SACH|nr:LAMI_0G11892g1_1 [Lachancea mirantina]
MTQLKETGKSLYNRVEKLALFLRSYPTRACFLTVNADSRWCRLVGSAFERPMLRRGAPPDIISGTLLNSANPALSASSIRHDRTMTSAIRVVSVSVATRFMRQRGIEGDIETQRDARRRRLLLPVATLGTLLDTVTLPGLIPQATFQTAAGSRRQYCSLPRVTCGVWASGCTVGTTRRCIGFDTFFLCTSGTSRSQNGNLRRDAFERCVGLWGGVYFV